PNWAPNRTHFSAFLMLTLISLLLVHPVDAVRVIGSKSLATCMANSGIGATTFDVSFTPDNSSFAFNINGVSTISGNVTGIFLSLWKQILTKIVTIQILAYGMLVVSNTVEGCSLGL